MHCFCLNQEYSTGYNCTKFLNLVTIISTPRGNMRGTARARLLHQTRQHAQHAAACLVSRVWLHAECRPAAAERYEISQKHLLRLFFFIVTLVYEAIRIRMILRHGLPHFMFFLRV